MPDRQNIKVLIVDDIIDTRENLGKLLLFERDIEVVGMAADGNQAVDLTGQLQPDVVLMDIHMPGMNGIAAAEAIQSNWTGVQVIMMSVHSESDYLRQSMVAGAREFLIKPFTGEELADSIRRVSKLVERRQNDNHQPAVQQELAAAPVSSDTGGRIISVFSPKGGIGCTTLACNLATALALKNPAKKVALVDCNLQFGDIGLFLNLQHPKTMIDLLPHIGTLDYELMDGVMAHHHCGLSVLLGPPRPEMAELVTAEALKKILAKLREMFDFVVVDTFPSFQETMLAVLDSSDRILSLLALEMPAIKNTKLFLEVTEVLGYPSDKTVLVLNRSDSSCGIDLNDVERSLNRRVAAKIVSDGRLVTQAVNQGVPFVLSAKDNKVTKAVCSLADYLTNGTTDVAATKPGEAGISKKPEASKGRVFGTFHFRRNSEARRI